MSPESLSEVVAKYGNPQPVYTTERLARIARIESGNYEVERGLTHKQKAAIWISAVLGVAGIGVGTAYALHQPDQSPAEPAPCHFVEINPTPTTLRGPAEMLIEAQDKELEQRLHRLPHNVCEKTTTR